jgi:hypothetical protein
MKKFVILLIALFIGITSIAQTQSTTVTSPTNPDEVKTLTTKIEQLQADLKKAGILPEEKKEAPEKALSTQQKFIIMLPVALFFMCLFITFLFARKYDFNFRKSFYSDDAQQITIQTDPINNPKDTVSITLLVNGLPLYRPSVSRIIAFISSLTTLAVIVCFISYYGYCMLKHQDLPVFENLFEIIFGLGLGIIPYGFNRITETSKAVSQS